MALAQTKAFLAHQVSLRSTGSRARANLVFRLWEGGSEKWSNWPQDTQLRDWAGEAL